MLVQAQTSNLPPEVSIVWPAYTDDCQSGWLFGPGTAIKIKANASDSDGSISNVQFFVRYFGDFSLIGVVSNPPFSLVWTGMPGMPASLKAVAVDNVGATTESELIQLVLRSDHLTYPVFAVTSPADGIVLAAPASFDFKAELLASSYANTKSVEFFLGTNSVGVMPPSGPFNATTPLYFLTVTNVPEGDYLLRVKQGDVFVNAASCQPTIIHVAKLGMQYPRLTPNGRFAFDVVTSFPTNQNIIEASSNLLNWTAISTNVPMTNCFTFTEPSPATNAPRYFRAVMPFP